MPTSVAFYALKRYNEALILAKKAVKLGFDRRREGFYFLVGSCLEKCERYQEALLELKKAEKINIEESQINFSLFNCYRNTGQIGQKW